VSAALEFRPEEPPSTESIELPIRAIRRDGGTQSRASLNTGVIEEYAELALEGIELPPIRVWFDGASYWLTDGFHRIAAAERAHRETVRVELFRGSLSDAQWDSYRANAVHGLRRTSEDLKLIVTRALAHERAMNFSNRELARHLHVSEKTIRRLREHLSAAHAADERVAVRNGREYTINTANIGSGRKARQTSEGSKEGVRLMLRHRLESDLLEMERDASPEARRILTIFKNWTQRAPRALNVLQALENVIAELKAKRMSMGSAQQH
jgi:hypothetical protein